MTRLIVPKLTGPIIDPNDPRLIEGTMVLFDLAHSQNPGTWTDGVPASGSLIPNLAWQQAAAVLGSGDESTLAATFTVHASFTATDASKRGAIERTNKGGLHVAVSQATPLVSGEGASIQIANAIKTFLAANPTDSWFVSLWLQYTRENAGSPASDNTGPAAEIFSLGMSSTSSNRILFHRAGVGPATATYSRVINNNDDIGPAIVNALASKLGTPTADGRVLWGAVSPSTNSAGLANKNGYWPSFAAYSMWVHDATVSGRTYAELDAIDYAAFQAAFGTDGRYEGDAWTDPATLVA